MSNKKKKVVVVLDNDECTGQYVMASVFHSHIVNNYPDTTNKNSKNYQTLVKLFSDYYLKINGISQFSLTKLASSKSNPCLVPSFLTDVIKNSPTPKSWHSLIQFFTLIEVNSLP